MNNEHLVVSILWYFSHIVFTFTFSSTSIEYTPHTYVYLFMWLVVLCMSSSKIFNPTQTKKNKNKKQPLSSVKAHEIKWLTYRSSNDIRFLFHLNEISKWVNIQQVEKLQFNWMAENKNRQLESISTQCYKQIHDRQLLAMCLLSAK